MIVTIVVVMIVVVIVVVLGILLATNFCTPPYIPLNSHQKAEQACTQHALPAGTKQALRYVYTYLYARDDPEVNVSSRLIRQEY